MYRSESRSYCYCIVVYTKNVTSFLYCVFPQERYLQINRNLHHISNRRRRMFSLDSHVKWWLRAKVSRSESQLFYLFVITFENQIIKESRWNLKRENSFSVFCWKIHSKKTQLIKNSNTFSLFLTKKTTVWGTQRSCCMGVTISDVVPKGYCNNHRPGCIHEPVHIHVLLLFVVRSDWIPNSLLFLCSNI